MRVRAGGGSTEAPPAAGDKAKPDWAGAGTEDVLSKVVNALIASPLYVPMKAMARKTLIDTAEGNGVAWVAERERLRDDPALRECYDDIRNGEVEYPSYYLRPFHAYDEGNLNWLAATEAESATYAMALRVWPKEDLTWQAAQDRLRDAYCSAVADFRGGAGAPATILDCGCSVGISTRALAAAFPEAEVTGLDLSPHMLAVAELRERQGEHGAWCPSGEREGARRITYVHGLAEETNLPDASCDVVSLAFVLHECPKTATRDIMQEAFRVLKPGGCLIMCDNDPKSEVIQRLPPVIFTLMKSTEPWSDDYYELDMSAVMSEVGFADVASVPLDPRHRAVLGRKP